MTVDVSSITGDVGAAGTVLLGLVLAIAGVRTILGLVRSSAK